MTLTTEQHAAVDHDGNLLLQACPGSGKTRTIIARLIREVEALRETPFAAACITYTNSAVAELEDRVAPHLHAGDERHYVISTIHAFCLNEILRPFASRVPTFNGAMKVLTRDRPEFIEIADHAAGKIGWFGLNYWDYERFGSLSLNAAGDLTGEALRDDQLRRAAPHFWRRCDELGFVDFANIIYRSYCLLRDDAEVVHSLACRFKAILVDEFQDTSELQIKILELIYAQQKSSFFLVGDPAQSVYAFAGAVPGLILPFGRHIGARTDLSLSKNFRSNPAIVQQANFLFPRKPPMVRKRGQTGEGRILTTRGCMIRS
jgi:DNA helicase-2/ATP-dependent DNA helicase PcrA